MVAISSIRLDPISAHIYRGVLEAHGVEAGVIHDVLSAVNPLLFPAESQVVIAEEDRDAAQEIVTAELVDEENPESPEIATEGAGHHFLPPIALLFFAPLIIGFGYLLLNSAILMAHPAHRYDQFTDILAAQSILPFEDVAALLVAVLSIAGAWFWLLGKMLHGSNLARASLCTVVLLPTFGPLAPLIALLGWSSAKKTA